MTRRNLKTVFLSAVLVGIVLTSVNMQIYPNFSAAAAGTGGASSVPLARPFSATGTPFALSNTYSFPGKTVLIYDGVETEQGPAFPISMSGFAAPSSNISARTTWIVGDGQTGSPTGNPGGLVNTVTFDGGSSVVTFSPALTGADGAANGNYLWDTESHDVSSSFAPGSTGANATVATNGDCVTWQAQVLDVGSSGALGGYAASGIGLRDRENGTISVSGIPAGDVPVAAFLYWGIINDTQPSGTMMVNGSPVTGTLVGSDISPCWSPTTYWGFKADVTPLVTGNGNYVISGYPTGETDNADPWGPNTQNTAPLAEGASLVIVYGPQQDMQGYMTGGGSITDQTAGKVTFGTELQCNQTATPNNLQVNWGRGNSFHLTGLTSAFCYDDASISPNPPAASFDTYIGAGTGTLNGVSGATAKWTFADAGEPGTNDRLNLTVTDASNNIVLSVSGTIVGNLQAHN